MELCSSGASTAEYDDDGLSESVRRMEFSCRHRSLYGSRDSMRYAAAAMAQAHAHAKER